MTCKLLIFKGAKIAIIGQLDFFDSLGSNLYQISLFRPAQKKEISAFLPSESLGVN
jgi:hypothetical protein